jgi:hypothetical protein
VNATTVKNTPPAELHRRLVQAFVTRADEAISPVVIVAAIRKIADNGHRSMEAVYTDIRNEARSLGRGVTAFDIPGFYQ